ncbi:hypothetical protein DFS34DRAFT_648057 [Phlyctochytrium arcticum]|nr:hypothetical protein DFS34DRAFT_648057 [Phlyctochytrium arcticum]
MTVARAAFIREKSRYIPSPTPDCRRRSTIHCASQISQHPQVATPAEEDDLPIALLSTSPLTISLPSGYLSHDDDDDHVSLGVAARLKEAVSEYVRLEEQENELEPSETLMRNLEKKMDHILGEIRGATNEADYLREKRRQEQMFVANAIIVPKNRRQSMELLRLEEECARSKVQNLQNQLETVQQELHSSQTDFRKLLHIRERLDALYDRVFADAAADFPEEDRLKRALWAMASRLGALGERREEGSGSGPAGRREMMLVESRFKEFKIKLLKERRKIMRWAVVRELRIGGGTANDLPPPYSPPSQPEPAMASPFEIQPVGVGEAAAVPSVSVDATFPPMVLSTSMPSVHWEEPAQLIACPANLGHADSSSSPADISLSTASPDQRSNCGSALPPIQTTLSPRLIPCLQLSPPPLSSEQIPTLPPTTMEGPPPLLTSFSSRRQSLCIPVSPTSVSTSSYVCSPVTPTSTILRSPPSSSFNSEAALRRRSTGAMLTVPRYFADLDESIAFPHSHYPRPPTEFPARGPNPNQVTQAQNISRRCTISSRTPPNFGQGHNDDNADARSVASATSSASSDDDRPLFLTRNLHAARTRRALDLDPHSRRRSVSTPPPSPTPTIEHMSSQPIEIPHSSRHSISSRRRRRRRRRVPLVSLIPGGIPVPPPPAAPDSASPASPSTTTTPSHSRAIDVCASEAPRGDELRRNSIVIYGR